MAKVAQTGTAAEEAGNDILLAPSRAFSRPHYPQHRHNLFHIDPEAANCARATSKFPRPSRHTSCTHDAHSPNTEPSIYGRKRAANGRKDESGRVGERQ